VISVVPCYIRHQVSPGDFPETLISGATSSVGSEKSMEERTIRQHRCKKAVALKTHHSYEKVHDNRKHAAIRLTASKRKIEAIRESEEKTEDEDEGEIQREYFVTYYQSREIMLTI
jgi:hypothetical protein